MPARALGYLPAMSHTLAVIAALTWPLPMIAALIVVARDRTLKHRVLWAVVSFVGVGAFWMQVSTGRWGFVPLAVNLLGPGSQPDFLKATIPAGAVAVLTLQALRARKRRRLRTAPADS